MKNKITLLFTALLSLFAISVFAHDNQKQESVYGVSFYQNSVEVIVKSNGCTKTKDFRLEELNRGDHILLNIIRINPDRCRAMSRPLKITLPINANQQKYYAISNSFVASKLLKKQQRTNGEK